LLDFRPNEVEARPGQPGDGTQVRMYELFRDGRFILLGRDCPG
jgi:hypothetical protein